jgi:glycosyltransferase involved in cell wall biosynthesis
VIGGQGDRMLAALGPAGVSWAPGSTVTQAVRQILGDRRWDVIHAHMTAAELAALLASPLVRGPVVATRHFAQTRGSSFPARLLGRALTPRFAAQLAISRYVAETTEGVSTVVAPGTDVLPDGLSAIERERMVLVAQRLEVEKHTEVALSAWQRSGLGAEGWELIVAGDGHERAALEARARDLGIEATCRFVGAQRDLVSYLDRAGILLAPRPDEPLGLSVIEAMAAGLPVVAAAGGGHDETVGIAAGAALFAGGDVDHAGRLLAELAHDPERRESYGRALREVQREQFTSGGQVASTLAVYESVLR